MIYLDYQATTPVAPEVAEAMQPWIATNFANPHSPSRIGREAAAAIEVARDPIISLLGGSGGRFFFTSGATEAANWALKGVAAGLREGRRKIVTVATEHAAVLDTSEWLRGQGVEIVVLPVGGDGLIDLAQAEAAIDDRTGLVAVMLVNNEIGVVQPVAQIADFARRRGAIVFCDSVQGLGRVTLPLESCDLIALSAHKIHGPKGIGGLWIREGTAVEPLLHGGGQEGGLRSGTLSPALCVGFGAAAQLMAERRDRDHAHVGQLWDRAWAMLGSEWTLNGSEESRYKGNLNIRLEGLDAARLISEVRSVAFSAGSACASGSGRPSHVLSALGLSNAEARSSIRIGFGRYTGAEELTEALSRIGEAARRQRSFAA